MSDLTGKTALVTGSTDGVGRMVATRLGAMGARMRTPTTPTRAAASPV